MKKETLTALRGSIEKWEKICEGTGTDQGADNCPLCQLFNKANDSNCRGCPVAIAGYKGCHGSPYTEWTKYRTLTPDGWVIKTLDAATAAAAELSFLRSLLPSCEGGAPEQASEPTVPTTDKH